MGSAKISEEAAASLATGLVWSKGSVVFDSVPPAGSPDGLLAVGELSCGLSAVRCKGHEGIGKVVGCSGSNVLGLVQGRAELEGNLLEFVQFCAARSRGSAGNTSSVEGSLSARDREAALLNRNGSTWKGRCPRESRGRP